MIDAETLDILNVMNQRISDLSNRFDDVFMNLHNQSTRSIEEITPYTATQTAYYGESEKVFYGVPQGNITVFWDNYNGDYSVQRIEDTVMVSFDTLTVAEATISIMVQ